MHSLMNAKCNTIWKAGFTAIFLAFLIQPALAYRARLISGEMERSNEVATFGDISSRYELFRDEEPLRNSQTIPEKTRLINAAKQGDPEAQYNLGRCYKEGRGFAKNEAVAVNWFRKAAEQGHALAQNRLGLCYEYGKGVEKNAAEAVRWYRMGAEQGYVRAQHNLEVSYANGQGVEKNEEEAMKWYRKAAEQGHAAAQAQIATSQSVTE